MKTERLNVDQLHKQFYALKLRKTKKPQKQEPNNKIKNIWNISFDFPQALTRPAN